MPVNIANNPLFAPQRDLVGEYLKAKLASEEKHGQNLQNTIRFLEGKRQFNASQAQQESQFGRGLKQRGDHFTASQAQQNRHFDARLLHTQEENELNRVDSTLAREDSQRHQESILGLRNEHSRSQALLGSVLRRDEYTHKSDEDFHTYEHKLRLQEKHGLGKKKSGGGKATFRDLGGFLDRKGGLVQDPNTGEFKFHFGSDFMRSYGAEIAHPAIARANQLAAEKGGNPQDYVPQAAIESFASHGALMDYERIERGLHPPPAADEKSKEKIPNLFGIIKKGESIDFGPSAPVVLNESGHFVPNLKQSKRSGFFRSIVGDKTPERDFASPVFKQHLANTLNRVEIGPGLLYRDYIASKMGIKRTVPLPVEQAPSGPSILTPEQERRRNERFNRNP